MSKEVTLEWCSGFFEGEGNFRVNFSKGKYKCGHVQIAQVYRESLDAFQSCMKVGVVKGPYGPYQQNKKAYYIYNAYGQDAVDVVTKMLPFLFQKGLQIEEALSELYQYQTR